MSVAPDDVRRSAAGLQVWAYPLVLAQRLRFNFTLPGDPLAPRPAVSAGAPIGRFGHARALADPDLRVGVAPNVDTLYSVAWLDLARGPHAVQLPTVGDRYFSLQVGKSDTTSPVVISGRTHPGQPPHVVVEPGEPEVVDHGDLVRVATRDRWLTLVGRTAVDPDSDEDLRAAHAVQDRLVVSSQGSPHAGTVVDDVDVRLAAVAREREVFEPGAFASAVLRVLDTGGESIESRGLERLLADVGIDELARNRAAPAVVSAVADGLRDGHRAIEQRVRTLGRTAAGWATNETVASFGDDHLLRAAVAHAQIYVNPPEEASYPVCEVDAEGRQLDGSVARYRVRLPAGSPPAAAFWSLTMYHAAGNLVANDLGRYAVGDRTPGLVRSDDGSLEVDISAGPPPRGVSNWLPAPEGPFRLMLRLYWPLEASWRPPAVMRVPA